MLVLDEGVVDKSVDGDGGACGGLDTSGSVDRNGCATGKLTRSDGMLESNASREDVVWKFPCMGSEANVVAGEKDVGME